MITYRIFIRSFTALSAVFTLATGIGATFAPSTARAETSVFSAFVDDVDDPGFMDYTDDACTPGQAGADACAAPTRAIHNTSGTTVRVPATGTPAPPAGTTTSIIMRDGGVCDPIRHMGC